jgi:ABC-2 type transport system permease protein
MDLRVIKALLMKYMFVCSRNTFRAMDVFFWPLMDLFVWGFLSIYMLKVSHALPSLITFLIGATILWNVLYRAQHAVSVMFLEDVWSRNLLNIFVAPIKTSEYVGAAYFMGLVQSVVVMVLLGVIAAAFYQFNLFQLGIGLIFLFANLMLMGCWLGLLTTGFILRWGPPAEALAWAVPFLIQPISGVFYPISVLPVWIQPLAKVFPSSYIFEGMREMLTTGAAPPHYLWCAFILNVVYMTATGLLFGYFLQEARRLGFLAKYAA